MPASTFQPSRSSCSAPPPQRTRACGSDVIANTLIIAAVSPENGFFYVWILACMVNTFYAYTWDISLLYDNNVNDVTCSSNGLVATAEGQPVSVSAQQHCVLAQGVSLTCTTVTHSLTCTTVTHSHAPQSLTHSTVLLLCDRQQPVLPAHVDAVTLGTIQ